MQMLETELRSLIFGLLYEALLFFLKVCIRPNEYRETACKIIAKIKGQVSFTAIGEFTYKCIVLFGGYLLFSAWHKTKETETQKIEMVSYKMI